MSGTPPGGGADPSMEDILASIRRILNEDDATEVSKPPVAGHPEVFELDHSMLVPEPPPPPPPRDEPPPPKVAEPKTIEPKTIEARADEPALPPPAEPAMPLLATAPPINEDPDPMPSDPPKLPVAATEAPPRPNLVAPEAAAAAAQSVGSLRRTLEGRASVSVRQGGPTLDEMVREELRPVLKAWLDANLPALVERLVRTEIERVVNRADI